MLMAVKRCVVLFLGILLQFGFAIILRLYFESHIFLISILYKIISVFIVLKIIKDSTRLSNDVPWIILILLFPIFGTILLITLGKSYLKSKLLRNIFKYEKYYNNYLNQDEKIMKRINKDNIDELKYLINTSKFVSYENSEITYYDYGEKFYPELLHELKSAQKYIFMEYFIINNGVMWDGILNILKEKAQNGVDVRVIYDDMGSVACLDKNYPKTLEKYNIKCLTFNKLSSFNGVFLNNRDHRKMTIIDGKVAFSGGVNISDEYINKVQKHGIWKDNAVKIKGDAVYNFVIMFLTIYSALTLKKEDPLKYKYEEKNFPSDGLICPFGVSPLKKDLVGEDAYINLINNAKKYLYIMTPYLIIDNDLLNSLIRASKRGVDVRIIVPGIPDKKIVYTQTSSFFKVLIENNIKIYKFLKGFVHSKVLLSDDISSIVGTINLDYRSLYLHFENGIYLYKNSEIKKIKNDFDDTFKECKLVTKKDIKTSIIKSIYEAILRLFAPLF